MKGRFLGNGTRGCLGAGRGCRGEVKRAKLEATSRGDLGDDRLVVCRPQETPSGAAGLCPSRSQCASVREKRQESNVSAGGQACTEGLQGWVLGWATSSTGLFQLPSLSFLSPLFSPLRGTPPNGPLAQRDGGRCWCIQRTHLWPGTILVQHKASGVPVDRYLFVWGDSL